MSAMLPAADLPGRRPLLPLKNVVIFPRNVVTLLVGRPRSVRAVDHALATGRQLIVTAHRDPDIDDPAPEDLHQIGTLVAIVSSERQSAGNVQVVLEGISRVRIDDFANGQGFFTVLGEELEEVETAQLRKLVEHQQQAVALLTAMAVPGLIFHQCARDLTDEETHQRHEAWAI